MKRYNWFTLRLDIDLLQDYTHEFHKTKANFMTVWEREKLMGLVQKDIDHIKVGLE